MGGKGNQGVAAAVQNTPNSIGYVELSYAVQNNIVFASLVNKAGKTVKADAASTQAAMADFADKFTPKLTAVIVDGAGDASYPIVGYTYLVLHTNFDDRLRQGTETARIHPVVPDRRRRCQTRVRPRLLGSAPGGSEDRPGQTGRGHLQRSGGPQIASAS